MGAALMAAASPIPLYRSPDDLRERLTQMRDDFVDRMVRRGNPEPAHLPMLAGIEADELLQAAGRRMAVSGVAAANSMITAPVNPAFRDDDSPE